MTASRCITRKRENPGWNRACFLPAIIHLHFLQHTASAAFSALVLLFSIAFIATASSLNAQQLSFQHLSIEAGLSESNVNCIEQDDRGFVWFGTQDGLNRYDGYNFIVYRQDALDSTSISNNFILALLTDKKGGLWIGTGGGGLNRLDCRRNTFHHYRYDPRNPGSIASDVVTCLLEDRRGVLWIGTQDGGLDCLLPGQSGFSHFIHDPRNKRSVSHNSVLCIFEDHEGTIWIGTEEGLDRLDAEKLGFTCYRPAGGRSGSEGRNAVSAIFEDRHGMLWVGTADGELSIFNRGSGDFVRRQRGRRHPTPVREEGISAICEDTTGTMWIGTRGGGLERIDAGSGTSTIFQNSPGVTWSLSNDFVFSLHVDAAGAIWVGTSGGINKFDRQAKQFSLFRYDPGNSNSVSAKSVTSFCQDRQGTLWIGTAGEGLNRFKPKSATSRSYRHDRRRPTSLANDYVRVIHEDAAGVLWIGTDGGGLDAFDRRSGIFRHHRKHPATPGSLSNDVVLCVLEDHAGTLWFGTDGGGLCQFNRRTESFTSYTHDPGNPSSIPDNSVVSLLEDSHGTFWVGTYTGGLSSFDRTTGRFVTYKNEPSNPKSLRHNFVRSLLEDSQGRLWVGTFGGGLNLFDRATGTFTAYTAEEGLPNNVIYAIVEDDVGDLWLSTNRGLARFTPGSFTCRNYDVRDGLQSDEFNGGAGYKDREGLLYFGGIRGFNAFNPDSIRPNLHVPPVVLTDFRVFERSISRYLESGQVEITQSDNFFGFEFAALNYTIPEKNRYAYKLDGFDKDWISCGTRRYATYTNLDGGRYVFHVKASNNDGVWNESGTSLIVIVNPPFWKTWWFTAILAGMLAIALGSTIRYIEIAHLNRKLQELEHQRSFERERLRISEDMHDEVGGMLTEIAILSERLRRDIQTPALAELHIRKISERSRQVIDNISEIIWAINPNNNGINNLAAYLRRHIVQYLHDTNIRCEIDFPDAFPDLLLSAESRRNIFLVVKEALHNTVKHAGATEVHVALACYREWLKLRIVDNGKGFSSDSTSGFGNGLLNMRRRMEHIGGTLEIQSGPGRGTAVHIAVAIGEEGGRSIVTANSA